jgi:dTDP-4-amino-4,6-dideoxygalactose transaminase
LITRHVKLAVDEGNPVREEPLPLEFPGMHCLDEEATRAVTRVLPSRSLFRYYGMDLQAEVAQVEAEFARFLNIKRALTVTSGTAALDT